MSGFGGIWVGDLDSYISIDFRDERYDKCIEDEIYEEIDEIFIGSIDNIELLGDELVEPIWLVNKNISHSEWNFEVYRAKRYLREEKSWERLEPLLIKSFIYEGCKYAVRRYAKDENIPVNEAIIATLPNGLQALLSRFFERGYLARSKFQCPGMKKIFLSTCLRFTMVLPVLV
ncbi:MAG: hypothetical protein K9K38_01720 [Rhodoferax sp.]|nr:hypothetical protein [Rhodoferax sp.]